MSSSKLPDNCVQYDVFLLDGKKGVSKTAAAFPEALPKLEALCDEVYALLGEHFVDYIWQAEPFRLAPFKKPFPHVGGRTVFGDAIEDEWFIVYLLLELSKRFENAAIAVYDNDGQFLLIEAAEYLPAWLGPENSENRVWIYRGQIHIIPEVVKSKAGDNGAEDISIEEALAWLAKDPKFTAASKDIQGFIRKRIAGYPKRIAETKQISHCFVPAAVAVLAKTRPSLLSAAVQAFYLRDPIDLRACKAMKHFPPETRVLSDVVTSKLQYAQLVQQKYHPDKRTGWDMPTPDDPYYKSLDLGVKIASGFEILCAYGERVKDAMQVLTYEEVESDPLWKLFWSGLEKGRFMKDVTPGSDSYRTKLNKAKDFFIESRRTDEVYIPRERYGAIILQLLRTLDVDVNALKKRSLVLPPADDDSWLNVSPDQLDALLRERSAPGVGGSTKHNGSTGSASNFDPSTITESIKKFMESVSGFEGAEFADEKDDPHGMDTRKMDQAIGQILELNISDGEENDGRVSSAMTDYSDEEDPDLDLPQGKPGQLEKNLQEYLQRMDRELAKTAVGQSFVRQNGAAAANGARKANGTENQHPGFANGKRQHSINSQNGNGNGHSQHKKAAPSAESDSFEDDEEDDYRPVDVNINLLKNILESCSSEQGMAGPASNMLKRMGVNVPPNNGKDSDDE
ncbi:Protein ecdysoneless-like protein [Hypsibius exemplaris]|uniref:Protein ecdysoneless-like protein n=1 Tax=Hypsibius exemplaris TaxID=2072580 RepID=A0A1W0WI18_HYPEX|nr:Protein ecdysoneless-like protein [Hypsibius exemplaris]